MAYAPVKRRVATLADLQHRARQSRSRGRSSSLTGFAGQLDAALVDEASRLRRRADAERVRRAAPAGAPGRRRGASRRARPRASRRARTTLSKCSCAACRRPPRRASVRRSSAPARASLPLARRPAAARSRPAPPLGEHRVGDPTSSGRTSPRAARSEGCCCPSDELIFSPSHDSRSGVVSTTCGSTPYCSITSRPVSRL